MTERLLKTRSRKRFWVIVFIVVAVLIAAIGYNQYREEEKYVTQERITMLQAIGALKANQIAEWRKERLSDAIRFAQGPALVIAFKNFIQKPDDPDRLKAAKLMLDLNRKGNFYQNTLMASLSGEIILADVEVSEPLHETTRQAVQRATANHAPELSGIYRCATGHVHIDVAAPVCDDSGAPFAVFILRADASSFLYPLIRFWPTDSPSAETLLARRDGDSVVFLNDVRHKKDTALTLRVPITQTTLPAVQAALGYKGIFEGLDYRGVGVLSYLRPIAQSDWALVTKIDLSEIQEELSRHASVIIRFASLGILLVAALIVAGFRKRQSLLYRNLYQVEREQREAHEKFETILYSIGDAVIVTDNQGCVRQMNAVAEHLTGWKEADAKGKLLEEVFHIVNEESRQAVENPVWRVLREGKIVGLANHTILIARDGIERPIADSGAPIYDEHGKVSGVVLVFRDQSADYAAQKALRDSEAQYSDLFRNMTEGFALHEIICDPLGRPVDYRFLKVNPAFEQLTGLTADRVVGHRVLEALPDTEFHWIETYGIVAQTGKAIHFENFAEALGRYFRVTAFCPRPNQFCTIFDDITERKRSESERKALEQQLQQSQRVEAIGRLAGGVAHDFNNMLAVIVGNAELAKENLDVRSPLVADLQEIIKAGKRSADLVRQLLAFASRQTISPHSLILNDTITGMLNMLHRLIGEEITLEWKPAPDLWQVILDPSQIDQVLVNLTVNARDAINGIGKISIQTSNETAALSDDVATTSPIPDRQYVLLSVSDNGCGMDAETQSHIFEPFFTTKQKEVGTGLGLSTVYGIVKQNQGFIRVDSEPGQGTTFRIYLPRHLSEALTAHMPVPLPEETPRNSSETILLVEDEPALLKLTKELVRRLGYVVLAACGPNEALQISSSYIGDIHLLMTDVVMPNMSGHELWKLLIQERPSLKSLYISGYTADVIAHHGIIESDIHFLQKPFSKESLSSKLREVLSNTTPLTRR